MADTHPIETLYVGDDWRLLRTVPAPYRPLTGKTFTWLMTSKGGLDWIIPPGAAPVTVLDAAAGLVEVFVDRTMTALVPGSNRYYDALRINNTTDSPQTVTTVVTGQMHVLDPAFDATDTNTAWVGPEGPPGPPGPEGPPGPGTPMVMEYVFSVATAAPPSTGQLRLNNADLTLATNLWISTITAGGTDVSPFFSTVEVDDELYVQDKDNSTNWYNYKITTGLFAPPGPYLEYTVTWLAGAGSFVNNANLLVVLTKK